MSKHSLRILIVEASGRGFLNHYSHALALGLHLCNVDVQLLTGVRDELSDWELPYPKQSCLEKGRSGWRCVREIIIQQQPDVVHLQWVDNPLTVFRLVQWIKRRGIKVIYTPHNILPHEKRWMLMPFYRLLYRAMNKVIARDIHIAWALEELLDVHKETIQHIAGSPNLLAIQPAHSTDKSLCPQKLPGENRFLFFGHGSSRKGLDVLLKLLSENNWPQRYHLVLAGEGVLAKVPGSLIENARKKIKVSVINQYIAPQKVAMLFADADLLLMPYIKQCKSPLLDLAAALKLPVLKSDRVNGAEFREHIHGLTFPHEDPSLLLALLNNSAWIDKSKNNLSRLEPPEASMQRLALAHKQLYQNILYEENRDMPETTMQPNEYIY